MSEKVVKLTGHVLPNEPSQDVVSELRRLLASAERGEIIGIAYATAHPNGTGGTGWTGEVGTKFALAAMVMRLHARYSGVFEDGE